MNPLIGAAFGVVGVLVLFGTLLHLTVRGLGGWRAVGRGLRREARLTSAAFAAPVRTQLRHRRRRRLLVQLLGRPEGWGVAERAMAQATAVAPGVTAYGALLDPVYVGVLVAGGPDLPRPPAPWIVDDDPRLWWIERTDVAPHPAGPPPPNYVAPHPAGPPPSSYVATRPAGPAPLLVALGADEEHGILLDLLSGPATVAVQGDPRPARTLVAAIAAQLDARLPRGAVTVARGVHDRHPGPDDVSAVSAAHRWAASTGAPAFAICAAAPAGPPPPGVRVVVAGAVRGTARLVVAHADGAVDVHGTPLRADAVALPRALATVLRVLPPYVAPGSPDDDLTEPPLSARAPAWLPDPAPPTVEAAWLPQPAPPTIEPARHPDPAPPTAETTARLSQPAPAWPTRSGTPARPGVPASGAVRLPEADADGDLAEPGETGRPAGLSATGNP